MLIRCEVFVTFWAIHRRLRNLSARKIFFFILDPDFSLKVNFGQKKFEILQQWVMAILKKKIHFLTQRPEKLWVKNPVRPKTLKSILKENKLLGEVGIAPWIAYLLPAQPARVRIMAPKFFSRSWCCCVNWLRALLRLWTVQKSLIIVDGTHPVLVRVVLQKK